MIRASATRAMTAALTVCLALSAGATWAETVAVYGDTVHTMAGAPIDDGVVVIQDGKIVAVGPAASVRVPGDAREIRGAVVTPGLIDAHTVVGVAGYLNQPHDQDQLERSAPMQPELRAIDGYNAREALVAWIRSFGVTTIHTGHGPGTLISGQTMIAKTSGDDVDSATLVPTAMIAATLGPGATVSTPGKHPGNRSKAVAMLRGQLIEAQVYRGKMGNDDEAKRPGRNLRLEALVRVLDGELPLMVTVHRYFDILAALRVADEFGIELVLDGAAESYLVIDRIRDAGVSIILHPTMARAVGEAENLSLATAAMLAEEGVPFALQSGFESYVPKTRVVLYEAAVAAAYGLDPEKALASITIDAARLLGVDERVGSLEAGKDGDVAVYDGDPFEYTSHCVAVVIDGQVVSEEMR